MGPNRIGELTYAAITPARNEATNLPRVAACLARQTVLPRAWIIVDNGSTDETFKVARALGEGAPWIRVLALGGEERPVRGGPVVRAFQAGLGALAEEPDVIVKLDADVSMASDYFESLLAAFVANPALGMASGSGHNEQDGAWVQRHVTAGYVWAPARAYRWQCLQDVLPLEERMGWDGIDVIKANAHGWETRTVIDLPFRHHRRQGERDGLRHRHWQASGESAHHMGYRFSYLVIRSLFCATQEPAAIAMIWGYLAAALRRKPRCDDTVVRTYLRRQQRLRNVPFRMSEVLRRRSHQGAPSVSRARDFLRLRRRVKL